MDAYLLVIRLSIIIIITIIIIIIIIIILILILMISNNTILYTDSLYHSRWFLVGHCENNIEIIIIIR